MLNDARQILREVEWLQVISEHLHKVAKTTTKKCLDAEINKAGKCKDVFNMTHDELVKTAQAKHLWYEGVHSKILPMIVARGNEYHGNNELIRLKAANEDQIGITEAVISTVNGEKVYHFDPKLMPRSIDLWYFENAKDSKGRKLFPHLPNMDYMKVEAKKRGLSTKDWEDTPKDTKELALACDLMDEAIYQANFPLRERKKEDAKAMLQPLRALYNNMKDKADKYEENAENVSEPLLRAKTELSHVRAILAQNLDVSEDEKIEAKTDIMLNIFEELESYVTTENDVSYNKNLNVMKVARGNITYDIPLKYYYTLRANAQIFVTLEVPKYAMAGTYFLTENNGASTKITAIPFSRVDRELAYKIKAYWKRQVY